MCCDGSNVPNYHCMLLMHPSEFNITKFEPPLL